MPSDSEWINITEASRRYGHSRHSIARLIDREGIETCRSGRSRLVRVADIESALEADIILKEPGLTELLDDVLRIVYSAYLRQTSSLFPGALRELEIEELREGRLGNDLKRIAMLARGDLHEPRKQVEERLASVFQLLFWAPMALDFHVPYSFWETRLGRVFSLARHRAYEPSELMSVTQAANRLDVTRQTIFRWMDEGRIDFVRDDAAGLVFIPVDEVEALLRAGSTQQDDGGQQDRGPPLECIEKQSMLQHRLLHLQPH